MGPMAKILVVVESPAKARTISRFLGEDYQVESSIGHIRDLPSTAAEIPAKYKKESWARLGVDVEQGFKPLYIVPASKRAQVAKLKKGLKVATELVLATDEDREGEAIAWHLVEVLKPSCPVKRMVFHEITKGAIAEALENPRSIDVQRVSAQEARRILDRLVGYEVSPLLWRKVRPKLSAGRVQSVATRLIVDREWARIRFVTADYSGVEARLKTRSGEIFTAKLAEIAAQRIATGKDFDGVTGKVKGAQVVCLDAATARAIADELSGAELEVTEINEKPFTTRPYPPFMTSTLQQEAWRKLRFNAQRTMRVAQSLYENGYITYMRTDSTILSKQALGAARRQVAELYGDRYLFDRPRVYAKKAKLAQEAHEAIRPAGDAFRTPDSLVGKLDADQRKLYELIWKRTLASQMKDARGKRTSVRVEGTAGEHGTAALTTWGKVIVFDGFLRAYVEGLDEETAERPDQEKVLPHLEQGQPVDPVAVEPTQHSTQPPARYTEASLVKELEARGIGRPSTYASIVQTIQDRGYVWRKGPALVPTFTAFAVINLMLGHLAELVDYDFTARMEDELDTIARGEREPGPWLAAFYFGPSAEEGVNGSLARAGLRSLVDASIEKVSPQEVSRFVIGKTGDGDEVAVRVGRFGPYVQVGDSDRRASVPDDLPPDELTVDRALELLERSANGSRALGHDESTGKPVYVKNGRFGPYVQLGDPELTEKGTVKRGGKAKMASLWPSMSPESLTVEDALMLLSYPREVGLHPDNGELITAQDGRFGPYLKMGSESRSLSEHKLLATVDLEQAVELFKQPKPSRRGGSRAVLAELGQHPASGDAIVVKDGRFGAYVTDGVVNASVPKGTDPAAVTLEKALELLAAREQKLRDDGKDPRAPKAKKTSRKRTTRRAKK